MGLILTNITSSPVLGKINFLAGFQAHIRLLPVIAPSRQLPETLTLALDVGYLH